MSRSARPRGARLLAFAAVTVAATGTVLGAAPLASAAPAVVPATPSAVVGGGYVPLTPARVIDTHLGIGVPKARLGQGASVTTSLASRNGLPAAGGATAVVLDLAATGATTNSFLTAYKAGTSLPPVASLTFGGGVTTSNLVTVPLSSDGKISIYNSRGTTDVLGDVVGYYAAAENASYGGLEKLPPERYYDSRTSDGPYTTGDYVDIGNDFGSNNANVTGWLVNVTAVSPTRDGYFTAWDGSGAKPVASSLNFRGGVTTSSLVQVKAGTHSFDGTTAPSFRIQATVPNGGYANIVVDVLGVFTKPGTSDDARFVPLATPQRVVDTRGAQAPNLSPQQTRTFSAADQVDPSTVALSANVTVVAPTASTFVSVSTGVTPDSISTVNANKAAVVANGVVTSVTTTSPAGQFDAYNSAGTTPLVVDVTGVFDLPATTPGVARAATAWESGRPHATHG